MGEGERSLSISWFVIGKRFFGLGKKCISLAVDLVNNVLVDNQPMLMIKLMCWWVTFLL